MPRARARPKSNASNGDCNVWHTVWAARVHNIQPFCGFMVYEGCSIIANNGKVCELGKSMRRERRWYETLPNNNNQEKFEHVCVPIGRGVPMYNFMIKIDDLGDVDVFEGAGTEFLGMFGYE